MVRLGEIMDLCYEVVYDMSAQQPQLGVLGQSGVMYVSAPRPEGKSLPFATRIIATAEV